MNSLINSLHPESLISTFGFIGILAILFIETGLLVGVVLPGDSLLFIAGVAASGAGAAILGGGSLNPLALFIAAPIAAVIGSQVGYWFGEKYGRKLFSRPDGRFFTQSKVQATEKWLTKYGTGKALVLARFIPFVRTLINPLAGIIGIPKRKFVLWNIVGAIIWTQLVIGAGYILGERLEGSVDKYLLPIIALIILVSVIPVMIEFYREWNSRRHHS